MYKLLMIILLTLGANAEVCKVVVETEDKTVEVEYDCAEMNIENLETILAVMKDQ